MKKIKNQRKTQLTYFLELDWKTMHKDNICEYLFSRLQHIFQNKTNKQNLWINYKKVK